jgi:hypothetical protein
MVQIDEKGNREETRHSPRRLKEMWVDGTGDQPPKENTAIPDARYIKSSSH